MAITTRPVGIRPNLTQSRIGSGMGYLKKKKKTEAGPSRVWVLSKPGLNSNLHLDPNPT